MLPAIYSLQDARRILQDVNEAAAAPASCSRTFQGRCVWVTGECVLAGRCSGFLPPIPAACSPMRNFNLNHQRVLEQLEAYKIRRSWSFRHFHARIRSGTALLRGQTHVELAAFPRGICYKLPDLRLRDLRMHRLFGSMRSPRSFYAA